MRSTWASALLLLSMQCGGDSHSERLMDHLYSQTTLATPPRVASRTSDRVTDAGTGGRSAAAPGDSLSIRTAASREERAAASLADARAGEREPGSRSSWTFDPSGGTALNAGFVVASIPRAAFEGADEHSVPAPWERAGSNLGDGLHVGSMAQSTGEGNLALRYSSLMTRQPGARATGESRYAVRFDRVLERGRLAITGELGERGERRYLTAATVQLETLTGWRAMAGDVRLAGAGVAGRNLSGRGVQVIRHLSGGSTPSSVSLLAGRAPVRFTNVLDGRYPREVAAVSFRRSTPGLELVTDAVGLSDHGSAALVGGTPIRRAVGTGVGAAYRAKRIDLALSGHLSSVRYAASTPSRAIDVEAKARVDRRWLTVGATLLRSKGQAFRAASLGAIEPIPRAKLAGDIALHAGRGSHLSAWGGRWTHGQLDPLERVEDENGELRDLTNRAFRGEQWGARAGTTIPGLRTGVGVSHEVRRRDVATGSQRVQTDGLSLTQRFSGRFTCAVQANRMEEQGRSPRGYASGNLSTVLPGAATLSLQQQTVWQEPFGPELLSWAELSTPRWGRFAPPASLRYSQAHSQRNGRFQPRQSEVSLRTDAPLRGDTRLSLRYQLTVAPSRRTTNLQLGLSHSFGGSSSSGVGESSARAPIERQLLGGVIFEDRNGDRLRQSIEPVVGGVLVALDNQAREPIPSDAAGRYRTLAVPGRHILRLLPESVPTEYSLEGTGEVEIDLPADRCGEHDFALVRRSGSIHGQVLLRLNDEASDPAVAKQAGRVAGIKVVLDGADFTYTDLDGRFNFAALPGGRHRISIDLESLPRGYRVEGSNEQEVLARDVTASPCVFHISRPVVRTRF